MNKLLFFLGLAITVIGFLTLFTNDMCNTNPESMTSGFEESMSEPLTIKAAAGAQSIIGDVASFVTGTLCGFLSFLTSLLNPWWIIGIGVALSVIGWFLP